MKTAKMVLNVLLALSLPLNVLASGSQGVSDGKELSIETKLEIHELKMARDTTQTEITRSTLAIKVLQDIADPTLLSFYRENDIQVSLGATTVGFLTMATIGTTISGYRKLPANSKLLPAFKGATAITAASILLAMAQIIRDLAFGNDYKAWQAEFKNSSAEEQKAAFLDHKERIVNALAKAEQIDKQLEALTK